MDSSQPVHHTPLHYHVHQQRTHLFGTQMACIDVHVCDRAIRAFSVKAMLHAAAAAIHLTLGSRTWQQAGHCTRWHRAVMFAASCAV